VIVEEDLSSGPEGGGCLLQNLAPVFCYELAREAGRIFNSCLEPYHTAMGELLVIIEFENTYQKL